MEDSERDKMAVFERQAQICKALSDPKRIMIIHALRDGERTVSDMVGELGLAQANLSQHLAVMRNLGLLRAERRGNNVYYSLSSARIVEACDIVRRVLVEQLEDGRKLAEGLAVRT